MLRVQISINQTEILDLHAQRMEEFKGERAVHDYHAFVMNDEKHRVYIGHIRHTYNTGAAELAKKLLVTYRTWEKV